MNLTPILEPVISGITFGLLLAVMLGPVFFALLQTSLHEGFKAGIFLAVGVLASDAALVIICYSFASLVQTIDVNHKVMNWVGGLLFIGFGVYNFFHRIKTKEVDDNKKTVHAHFVLKGFLLNIMNPAVLFFWLGVVGLVSVNDKYQTNHQIIFFISTLSTVFLTDILKSFISYRIKKILNAKVMLWLNRMIGLVLIGFGIHMLVR